MPNDAATAETMMTAAMAARMDRRPLDAAALYAVAGDLLEEIGHETRASIARYWAVQCSTFPLMAGVCR